MVRNLLNRERGVADPDDTTVDENRPAVAERPAVEEPVRQRFLTRTRRRPSEDTVVTEPVRGQAPVAPEREPDVEPVEEVRTPRHFRTSLFATLGLIIGVVALAATFTGLLAPVGIVLGAVGAVVALLGLVGASRRGVTGHSVALLGLACGVFAAVLGVLAMGHQISWLDSRTDEVARLRDWLDAHLSWLKNR